MGHSPRIFQSQVQPWASSSLLDFVIGFPGIQYPLHQAALLEQLGGKGEHSEFSKGELWILLFLPSLLPRNPNLSPSPAREPQLLPDYFPEDPGRAATPGTSPGCSGLPSSRNENAAGIFQPPHRGVTTKGQNVHFFVQIYSYFY